MKSKKNKEIDVERLRQLAEQQKAQIHIPFHSLRQSDEPQQTVLEKADHALIDYCSALPGDESAERCWRAVRYFEERVAEAQEGCVLPEGGRSAEAGACTAAERLEDFVRQFVGQAPTHMFVQTLLVLESADRHAKERQDTPRPEAETSVEEAARKQLVDLFYAMDSDLNGMLDVEEFRAAMRAAKRELPGDVVSKVLEAMDIHGRLTLDQFINIAEAEEIYADTPLAAWLRRSASGELKEYKHKAV
ncbi:hypothetical protein COCSUDRAFT_55621 [Coccomyxa subellipsoidea C-169]|uniref:EF-hand domain-containing protein n=1 Tax=Coccomyxa subellipsoidea (strain C-169) TaxID=574566 RepID=I0ZAG0_COCSC|nr:hypothetical protein COCSUDRAFT_55621 [Coccomyxa subellipsoidea C-169]EIE27629.1 hypothetical protein COCSUDRAFT_55621 [Coccomyxa subellipsoidea C-169]|eukprot:XP_005652173.1 hypothetical protein COCSUDRAFT_55621 [Coccomyxa subellipsoidea C-169]